MAEHTVSHSHKKFSKAEAIRFGWEMTKKNFWFLIAIQIIPTLLSWVFMWISQPLFDNNNASFGMLITVVGWIVNLELGFASFAILFKLVDKKKTSLKELVDYFDAGVLFRYFLVSFLYSMLVFIGFLLFVIPGIYFAIKYWFAMYIYVDKRTGVIESFKESAKLTKGVKWQLFLLGAIQLLIMLGGFLALFVGLLVAVPINYISDIYIYRKLAGKNEV